MPKFRVTYRCPKCDHKDEIEDEYRSWSDAMNSASAPCPSHEELGELQASKAVEVKRSRNFLNKLYDFRK